MSNANNSTPNHEADIENANSGTSGTNETYQQAQDNHANQLNPNHEPTNPKLTPAVNPVDLNLGDFNYAA